MNTIQRIPITTKAEVEWACRAARALATGIGFGKDDAERVVLTVSELATNLMRYAVQGEIVLSPAAQSTGNGLRIESTDAGPGIVDIDVAQQDGRGSSRSLGSGLAAVKRLMDDVTITSAPHGTRIVAYKWLPT